MFKVKQFVNYEQYIICAKQLNNTTVVCIQQTNRCRIMTGALMAQDSGNTELYKIINTIKRAEQNKRSFAFLRRINGKKKSSGLEFIISEDKSGIETIVVSNKS